MVEMTVSFPFCSVCSSSNSLRQFQYTILSAAPHIALSLSLARPQICAQMLAPEGSLTRLLASGGGAHL